MRRVVIRGVVGALLVFLLIWIGSQFFLFRTQLFTSGWLETLADLGGTFALLILTWILFPALVTIIVGIILEDAVTAVEAHHYPNLPAARRQSVGEVVWITSKFAVLAVILNLIFLPLYLVLLFVPPINFFVFYGLNGYLLGREYFELVAHRRLEPRTARWLRRNVRWQVIFAGAFIAFLMTIPLVNLVAPVVAAAAMVHLLEGWRDGNVPN